MGKYISECYLKNQYLYELERIPIGKNPEREDVKIFRRTYPYMWFYHGTKAPDEIIKTEGIKAQIVKLNIIAILRWGINSDLFGKKFVWMTTIKTNASLYTYNKSKILKSERGKILLIKVNTKNLECVINYKKLGDEYIYPYDIPPENILFPEDNRYRQIELKFKYLRNNPVE